jgi:hypothetical protein
VVHINPVLSLAIILGLLAVSVVASLLAARRDVGIAIEHADEPMHEPEIPADLQEPGDNNSTGTSRGGTP